MRNVILAVVALLVVAAVLFCGGNKEAETQQQATEQVQNQEQTQANQPQNRAELQNPNKKEMIVKNPNANRILCPRTKLCLWVRRSLRMI
jgi:flagellar basal body-associated protein FliL